MPKIYRVMQEEDGKPRTGASATTLGVRVPQDIEPDADGLVEPGTGGMSVSPTLYDLPRRMIPVRLAHLAPGATGRATCRVWSLGDGAFIAAPVAPHLVLRPDPLRSGHGFVEPAHRMNIQLFETAIQRTRDDWQVDEG